jgi:hypothetical protein
LTGARPTMTDAIMAVCYALGVLAKRVASYDAIVKEESK